MAAAAAEARVSILADRRLWLMAAFGVAAGLPLALSGFTLRQWLTERQISLEALGLTANIGLAYTLKFLWAPALDQVAPPFGLARFGRRRGWLLAIQPALVAMVVLLALSGTGPLWTTVAAAALVAFLSATQDIAIDAWRIETFPQRLQGAAMAAYVWGYRVAMLLSGAGAIAAAGWLGWSGSLLMVAALLALVLPVTLVAHEPVAAPRPVVATGLRARARAAVVEPLREFLGRPGAGLIIAYVALFNLGEAMAGVMLAPFYRSLGFDRAAVAAATGVPGLVCTMAGIAVGGWLVARIGLARALISTGLTQMAAMGMYVWLAYSHGDHAVLFATVMTEAFVQALATAGFITYLSGLCSTAFTATQYALLTSLAALASHTIGGFSGFLAAAVGWPVFYMLAMACALPGMMMMLIILRRFPPEPARR
ncbi:AmpG family muropeptide MFS transporter [Rhodovastum atsumiense]|uniref:AmpG family muropeptide MFS transporter n=2 Tax=Rhodovastum atsumiense TaxID=504468 RepID=A0A5M6IZK6_9PROT|nr:AmpG family muropeptide MFS transporter [Rhodovastum atsumiense]